DTSRPISLSGLITEEIARPDHPSSPYLFFRIGVRGPDGTVANWTIRIYNKQMLEIAPACDLCLLDDYAPEMSKLKIGMSVTLTGYRAKDGGFRPSLVPATDRPNTIAGIVVNQGR